jgi:hypothetical protein
LVKRTGSIRPFVSFGCRLVFWLGVMLAFSGQIMTFVPGAEFGWFLWSAILIAAGVFVPKRSCRIAAIVGCVLCLLLSYAGYQHGFEYHEWLRSH